MDHKTSNPGTDPWVDDRMAKLDPAPEWQPDSDNALNRLTQPKASLHLRWTRLAMTTTILAATVLVLVMLPWQRLWTPKPMAVATVAAQTQTGPAASQQSEKPVEKVQESLAPKESAETAKQAPAVQTPPFDDTVQVTPEEEGKLVHYLEDLALLRGGAAQASPSAVSDPVIVRNVIPQYSDEAKKEKIQGIVILTITVKTDGTVQFESFKQTLGYGLDEKAREAIEQWLFTPAKKDGVAVAKTIDVSINFSLR